MSLGYLLVGVGFASNALTRTLPLLVLTVVLFTLGEMVAMPVSGAMCGRPRPHASARPLHGDLRIGLVGGLHLRPQPRYVAVLRQSARPLVRMRRSRPPGRRTYSA